MTQEHVVVDYRETERHFAAKRSRNDELKDLLKARLEKYVHMGTEATRSKVADELWTFAAEHGLNFSRFKEEVKPTSDWDWFPEQLLAIDNINAGWRHKMPSMFMVGMRAGKTVMLGEIMRRMGADSPIFVVVPNSTVTTMMVREQYNIDNPMVKAVSFATLENALRDMQHREKPEEGLSYNMLKTGAFFIEDAFWYSNAEYIAKQLIRYTHRYVITTTGGPHEFELPDDKFVTYRAASWDWNPYVTVESLESYFAQDFAKASRDFGLNWAHNWLTASVIEDRYKR
jgi:hypothetical protein